MEYCKLELGRSIGSSLLERKLHALSNNLPEAAARSAEEMTVSTQPQIQSTLTDACQATKQSCSNHGASPRLKRSYSPVVHPVVDDRDAREASQSCISLRAAQCQDAEGRVTGRRRSPVDCSPGVYDSMTRSLVDWTALRTETQACMSS
eukprot:scaffold174291_cov18-Tisochrysis_lutea.AAC.1